MPSFEEQLAELETVVEQLERGDLSLEENVSLFERGMLLSGSCKKQLSSAESRIHVLLEPESGGEVHVRELDVELDDDEEVDDDEEADKE